MSTHGTVKTDLEDGIFTITLNRPDVMNAYNQLVLEDMLEVLDVADTDDAVRAVIVTGAGRAFCAGADLTDGVKSFDYANPGNKHAARSSPVRPDGSVDYSHPGAQDGGGTLALRIFNLKKPIIAAVNGAAYGVGATMTLAMDIRLVSERAKFGFVFTKIGVIPEGASSWFLPRLVGISRALEWCLGAKVVDAKEALDAGLVRGIYAPEDLMPVARALALSLTKVTSPVSVALTRQMLWRMLGADHPMEANKLDTRAIWVRGKSADTAEGITAILEKRDPVFKDKVSQDLPHVSPWMDKRPYN